MDTSKSATCQTFVWRKKTPIFASIFIYFCFCVSCLIVPDSVNFGACLCFAYFFSMIQMLEVASFMQGGSLISYGLMCLTLFAASIMPTMQMYQVIVGDYSKGLDVMYNAVYMMKEICLHIARIYMGGGTLAPSRIHSTFVVLAWITVETVNYTIMINFEEVFYGYENVVYIVRLTPHFYMACLSLLHATS